MTDKLVFPNSLPKPREPVGLEEIIAFSERLLPQENRKRRPSPAHHYTPFTLLEEDDARPPLSREGARPGAQTLKPTVL